MLDYFGTQVERGAYIILDQEAIEVHAQRRDQPSPRGRVVLPRIPSLHDRVSLAQTENANTLSDAELPPPYDEVPEFPPRALRIIGHVRACGYITTGEGACAEGCVFLGTTLLSRPWHMMVRNKGASATYVQLQLVHSE
jgi:hypothetical protein